MVRLQARIVSSSHHRTFSFYGRDNYREAQLVTMQRMIVGCPAPPDINTTPYAQGSGNSTEEGLEDS